MAANTTYLTAGATFDGNAPANVGDTWSVYGATGAEAVTMNANGGAVYGYGANDSITVGGGSAIAYGGDGNDSITASAGTNTVYGDAGTDNIVISSPGANTAYGGADADAFTVSGGGANLINGDAGADTFVISGAGANTVYGGTEADLITISGAGNNAVYGDAGTDAITVSGAGNNTLTGGAGSDSYVLTGSAGSNRIVFNTTLGSASVANADTTTDFVWTAGAAQDKVQFDVTSEALAKATYTFGALTATVAADANNSITLDGVGAGGTAVQFVAAYADNFYTTDAATTPNIVYAAANQAAGTGNADKYVRALGAAGLVLGYNSTAKMFVGQAALVDTVQSFDAGTAVTVDLTDATKYFSIEAAVGNTGNDVLRGLTTADALNGDAGNDSIWGRAGNDTLTGGTGNDTFYFGTTDGNDTIVDLGAIAANADTVRLWDVALSGITGIADGGAGTATTLTFTGGQTLSITNGEAALKTGLNRFILGGSSNQVMAVGTSTTNMTYASDVQYYYGMNLGLDASAQTAATTISLYDTTKYRNLTSVIGGTGADTIRGRHYASDVLQGGSGADQLWGGNGGNDTLTGDAAADVFWFGTSDGQDTITDYNSTQSDIVKLYNLTATGVSGVTAAVAGTSFDLNLTGNSADKLRVVAGAGQSVTFQVSDGSTFKVAQNGTYDAAANFYSTAGGVTTLNASADTAGVTINLYDAAKYGTGFTTVSGGTGNDILRGAHTASDLLSAGNGNNSLWGGSGGNDTLTAGTGTDTYYWGRADGNDTITAGADNKDQVMMYTSGLTTSNVTIGVVATTLTLTSDAGNTLVLQNWTTGGTNKFVFGYSQTSSNTYRITAAGAWEQVTA